MTDTWAEQEARRIAHELDFNAPLGAHHYGIIATALRRAEDRGCDKSCEVIRRHAVERNRSDVNANRAVCDILALKSSNAP